MFPDDLNQKASGIWDRNAGFWDGHFKEGNDFHRLLVSPSIERLLELQPGEQVLDVACGNGALARRLADLWGAGDRLRRQPNLHRTCPRPFSRVRRPGRLRAG